MPDLPVVVVGGGPAGLRAAEVIAGAGRRVALYEQKASVGRKFLVAGRGGLNLTHSELPAAFATRYGSELARWQEMLGEFGAAELRAWAQELGVETYVGTSGRVFPRGQQSARLLRRWVERLRRQGVEFHVNQRLEAIVGLRPRFQGANGEVQAAAVVLALGGASWPQTGSDGTWPESLGMPAAPWQAANCGWEVAWKPEFLAAVEGLPLKNVTLTAGGKTVAGEALITRYGVEGGAVYQLGRELRAMAAPRVVIDLKPAFTAEELRRRPLGAWKLSPVAQALLEHHAPGAGDYAEVVKEFPLELLGPRPIAEAISSAGGVPWDRINCDLMLADRPGVFVAGEMIDWEAPTGGYLLQGCFATGTRAGAGVLRWLTQSFDL